MAEASYRPAASRRSRPARGRPAGTGLLFVIATEAALFAYLLFSYSTWPRRHQGSGRRMASHPCGSRDRIP